MHLIREINTMYIQKAGDDYGRNLRGTTDLHVLLVCPTYNVASSPHQLRLADSSPFPVFLPCCVSTPVETLIRTCHNRSSAPCLLAGPVINQTKCPSTSLSQPPQPLSPPALSTGRPMDMLISDSHIRRPRAPGFARHNRGSAGHFVQKQDCTTPTAGRWSAMAAALVAVPLEVNQAPQAEG